MDAKRKRRQPAQAAAKREVSARGKAEAETHKAVGLVGLGIMGKIYAGHLLAAGRSVVGCDVQPRGLESLAARGLHVAATAREVAARAGVVILALPNPDALRAAVLGDDGLLAGTPRAKLVIDLSTADPFTCRELHECARAQGIDYLEAPVSGGEPLSAGMEGAKAANITFMVGGERHAFERAIPTLSLLGKHWFYLGPAGCGAIVKLISNLISGVNNLVAAEGFVLGAAAGIPWETLVEVFKHTDAKSYQMTDYMEPRMKRRDFDPGFTVDLQYKDLRLAGELGHRLKVPLLFNDLALQVYQVLRAAGRGGRDLTEALNLMGEWAGVEYHRPREPVSLASGSAAVVKRKAD
jgi:3-hydroxyisobutyrate dehydrogenase-like beta-hydroxyacid dehydrogenase